MTLYLLALLIGVVCGLRAMTGPAVLAWAAYLGWLHLENTWCAFLGHAAAAYILGALAILELVGDQLPSTPSRKVPMQFIARIIAGAFCGAVLAAPQGLLVGGLAAGAIGAVAGTLGGSVARAWLARTLGKDLPAALLEDIIAIGGAVWISNLAM